MAMRCDAMRITDDERDPTAYLLGLPANPLPPLDAHVWRGGRSNFAKLTM